MLIPPASFKGWKIWTLGDDICWMHPDDDGRLWAINPEAGFFGVAPGTGPRTNPNALAMLDHDTIFTNVGVTADNQPWWEGIGSGAPVKDWQGRDYDPDAGPAAHPNSRFTVSISQCPSYSDQAEALRGVPISAIIFGGRRERLVPLVQQSKDWLHGLLLGASMASETTAAATGDVGVVRRDPMAMKPFCGYNFADYWQHWLDLGETISQAPLIFHVNWFRKDQDGRYMWPGFGDNMRVLEWIIDRCNGQAEAVRTPIGYLPANGALNLDGLDIDPATMDSLLEVDAAAWRLEMDEIREYLEQYGERLPDELLNELEKVRSSF
jgi:phosphoenolpyruvate carboxykinase (GTP)